MSWSQFVRDRFILGKNKVMQVALGADESAEYRDNLSLLAQVRHCLACILFLPFNARVCPLLTLLLVVFAPL